VNSQIREATTAKRMKIDPRCQQQNNCSPLCVLFRDVYRLRWCWAFSASRLHSQYSGWKWRFATSVQENISQRYTAMVTINRQCEIAYAMVWFAVDFRAYLCVSWASLCTTHCKTFMQCL